MIDSDAKITRAESTVHRELAEGGGVLLNLESGSYYSINSIGLLVWGLIADGCTFDELVSQLRSRVADAPPELDTDIREFLGELEHRRLIEVGG
ncbi:MAG TPA: PqqD family protein [Actinomycetota bacterium]|jgi:hypothetical protein|nr:PqqD family protein [Actinomycetota bacterium]